MHLKDIVQRFNASHFIIYCCLLLFSILLSLQVDGVISQSYGLIFLPLWVWKTVTFAGATAGIILWVKKKKLRKEKEQRQNFVAMLQSSLLQFIIFVEEILIAINLDLNGRLSWPAVFVPLYVLSVVSLAACILSCALKKCNVELEILGFINLLQLIFLGVRLEGVVMWRWAVVLIPTWILLVLTCCCVVLYACIQCCLINAEENQPGTELRKPLVITSVLAFSLATLSFTIFLALLVSQLDGKLVAPYMVTFVPLHLSILCLFPTLFTRRPANPLWFGVRMNFAEAALALCPLLGEYLNVSWTKNADEAGMLSDISAKIKGKRSVSKVSPVAVVGVFSVQSKDYRYLNIMMPD